MFHTKIFFNNGTFKKINHSVTVTDSQEYVSWGVLHDAQEMLCFNP